MLLFAQNIRFKFVSTEAEFFLIIIFIIIIIKVFKFVRQSCHYTFQFIDYLFWD